MDEPATAVVPGASRRGSLRSAAWLGAGTLIAIIAASIGDGTGQRRPFEPGPVALWAVDRDAGCVYALDSDLMPARRLACVAPLAVEPCSDGGVWLLCGVRAANAARQRLERRGAAGELRAAVELDPLIDLCRSAADDALVIEAATARHADRASRVRGDGTVVRLLERDGLTCIASAGPAIALGTSAGEVLLIVDSTDGGVAASVALGGCIGDLARGPDEGYLWALEVSGSRRLHSLGADLQVRWSTAVTLSALHCAPVPGEERVWLACASEPRVCRFGPGGALELDVGGLPLLGLDRALAWREGGALLLAPGAILHVDASGRLQPGQGGFNYLVSFGRAR